MLLNGFDTLSLYHTSTSVVIEKEPGQATPCGVHDQCHGQRRGNIPSMGLLKKEKRRRLASGAAGMEEVARVIERPREAPQNSATLFEQLLFAGHGKAVVGDDHADE